MKSYGRIDELRDVFQKIREVYLSTKITQKSTAKAVLKTWVDEL